VCSLAAATADGQTAGVALVGSEGAIGLRPFGGEGGVTAEVEIVDGEAMVMDLAAFRGELARGAAFADLIERYTIAFGAGLMQSVACNALHPVERRFARLLLDIRDRIGRDAFPLTHYALAAMLGVRRATVTLCARSLHRKGLVECHHKHVVIHDSKRLEKAACECYHIVKGHFARWLP
jgi:CRP-like cAMP-binding protein